MRPHRWHPTRLPRPWDSPGKNTGVGCHFLLPCRKVKSESEVAQSHPMPRCPMDHSPPGSPAHGIFQARVLEWGAVMMLVNIKDILLWETKSQNRRCILTLGKDRWRDSFETEHKQPFLLSMLQWRCQKSAGMNSEDSEIKKIREINCEKIIYYMRSMRTTISLAEE